MKKNSFSLLSGSFTLLIAYNLFNICNFLYQFSMARLLTPVEYGALATLFTVVYFVSLFSDTLQTTVTTFISKTEDKGKIKDTLIRFSQGTLKYALSIWVAYSIIVFFIAPYLKLSSLHLLLIGTLIPLSFVTAILRGGLQGTQKFKELGLGLILESFIKVGVAVCLVLAGWALYGAIWGVIIGALIILPLSSKQLQLKKITRKESHLQAPFKKGIITLILMLGIVGFYSFDLLIARLIFSEEIAGNYALAALLGKVILWGTMPIGRAYLPIAVMSTQKKKKKLLIKAGFFSGFLVVLLLSIYLFFSGELIHLFSGKELPIAAGLLFKTGIAMSVLTFLNLYFLYLLANIKEDISFSQKRILALILTIGLGLLSEIILLSTAYSIDSFTTRLIIASCALGIYVWSGQQVTK
ncbi:hypothetical protein FJZ22_00480 [Candidatus Pacearchaeota archaeon]|nr:hypothetical protein [Candidatus Pacearchaeota archaeon]